MALETVPKDLRHLRACLLCSLVKTIDQFEYDGCDNCEAYLQMKGNREMVYDCTSSSFDGVIAMMSPEDSWVSKWQRISNFKPGVYAVTVTGRLPPGMCICLIVFCRISNVYQALITDKCKHFSTLYYNTSAEKDFCFRLFTDRVC
ncbi:Transcription elongation factor SPT4 [Acipenser ruthenus]|uniref:Transcription elongation factor SPT4 n=1 Tax=Acipenser ruthenus TaxID=7906 RepID=A0A444U4T5_ACIRT|nr:Transcription elongation factor SPT4 [Acipenser ruthenus]